MNTSGIVQYGNFVIRMQIHKITHATALYTSRRYVEFVVSELSQIIEFMNV